MSTLRLSGAFFSSLFSPLQTDEPEIIVQLAQKVSRVEVSSVQNAQFSVRLQHNGEKNTVTVKAWSLHETTEEIMVSPYSKGGKKGN